MSIHNKSHQHHTPHTPNPPTSTWPRNCEHIASSLRMGLTSLHCMIHDDCDQDVFQYSELFNHICSRTAWRVVDTICLRIINANRKHNVDDLLQWLRFRLWLHRVALHVTSLGWHMDCATTAVVNDYCVICYWRSRFCNLKHTICDGSKK